MDKVSIILPLYNCEKYVRHTIESVQRQDYQNWELIVMDDASTDKSLDEVYKYAEKDPRIKVYSSVYNRGVAASRNAAIKFATGKYLAFVDADDLWAKNKLSSQIFFMKKHHAGLSHTSFAYLTEDGHVRDRGQIRVDECIDIKRYMKTSQIGMSTVMIDRDQIKYVHFPEDRKLCEDARLWMKYLREGKKFYGLDKTLLLYRVRPNQLSRRKDKMAWAAFKRYMGEKSLSWAERIGCYAAYAKNALRKYEGKSSVDMSYIKDQFNCR
ncbi:MAG: glycosyltransferase family 2 protein [Alphaproteobacteria bacterium]|nr:glycosyltransferase family 2 protein [Alphaproteobacteria bacterium]